MLPLFVFAALAAACNDASLITGQPPHPTPTGVVTPTPTGTNPSPTPTPPEQYVGREFYAVDLDNQWEPGSPSAALEQFGVTISNPDVVEAHVVVSNLQNGVEADVLVQPGEVRAIELPVTVDDGWELMWVNDTVLVAAGYRIESDVGVTAHQFNPIDNSGNTYSSDASLLLPVAALGTTYRVLSWPQSGSESDPWTAGRGFFTIVATEDGTSVTVTPRARTVGGDGIPAVNGGQSLTRTLNRFDVLSFATSTEGDDLTGSLVVASKKVAVFGGTECSNVPVEQTACDHLEEQMFPVPAWGRNYVAAKSKPRGSEPDVWRVLAAEPGTLVTTDPPQPGTPVTLAPGQFVEFESRADFLIHATSPVTVGQYLVGRDYGAGTGDPSLIALVPTEQFLADYLFPVPTGYAQSWITLIAPAGGAAVQVDGTPVAATAWAAVGTEWRRARLPLTAGTHRITCGAPCGVTVFGFDSYISYGYPGGANLAAIE